jgi:divalent metal cation (Fe/Co/Zn/Cd) transporter
VAEIQKKVVKQSRRNAVSRLLHARNDKETIGGWRLELNRILHVFNVRSVVSGWSSLTVGFQTELAVTTHVTVSDMHTIVSNIRDDMSKMIREGIGSQVRPVSANRILFVHNRRMPIIS